MKAKHKVLLILEGTYPFNGGGVSTWAHMLCEEVRNVDYSLYSINAEFETTPRYTLGENVKNVTQVPMWSPLEPQEMLDYGKKYYKFVACKEQDDTKDILDVFLPVFERLLTRIYADKTDVEALDDTIYDMWRFFQNHDYKKVMTSELVWKAFCYHMTGLQDAESGKDATMLDLTVAMRWIYRFLMPLSVKVPKADIAHLTLSGFPVIPALVLKYKYGTPLIVTEHGVWIRERLIAINNSEFSFFLKKMLIKFSETITELVYHKADKILSVNKFNMQWETLYGANADKIEVIYNGIDHNKFTPAPKPEHLRGTPTVVAAARIFELKDILTMIRSCHVAKQRIPNVKYLVYGDSDAVPEYSAECRKLIAELGLRENFILAGYHAQPDRLFCEGDISILTSISEGFPYTVLESMSCGIPVVATDVGGVTEALDENCGYICKPKDHVEIGNRVVELLLNPALRAQMGAAARRKVVENFTIGKFISEYEKVYDRVARKDTREIIEPIYIQLDQQRQAAS
jgi:glycosyltransferase involved in cell wall biosynthesis